MILEKDLNAKIKALCNDTAKLEQIKTAIENGVTNQYPRIQALYKAEEAGTEKFKDAFSNFYHLRGVFNRKEFYDYIAAKKECGIRKVLLKIADKTSQLSFASKALHTINNDLPIYDSLVANFLGIKRYSTKSFDGNVDRDEKIYGNLTVLFQNRNQNGLSELVKVFDDLYPSKDYPCVKQFSDVKKIDFIIWGNGRIEKKEKKKK